MVSAVTFETRRDDNNPNAAARPDNIVSLQARRLSPAYPALEQVEAYWSGLRRGRVAPARAEIDPRGMTDALEYAFVLERIAPGVGRFRLAGMHLSDLMGMDVRGMPLSAMLVPESRAQLSEALEAVFTAPQSVRLSLQGDAGVGRRALQAELLLCPLKSDLGDLNRALGCLQSRGPIGRPPRRFRVTEIRTTPLLADAPFRAPGFAEARRPYQAPPKATPKAAPDPAPIPPREVTTDRKGKPRPALRLIKTDV